MAAALSFILLPIQSGILTFLVLSLSKGEGCTARDRATASNFDGLRHEADGVERVLPPQQLPQVHARIGQLVGR